MRHRSPQPLTPPPGSHPSQRRIPLAKPSFGQEEERLLSECLRSGWVTQGPRVAQFEELFATTVGAGHAVAVSSCSSALFLSLFALGIGSGDEVILPSLSFIASANCVAHCGATPVFVDVDTETYNLDPEAVRAAVTPRTRAIMVVHQLGLPVDLDLFHDLAAHYGISIIEDAACAVGSGYRDRPIGSFGNLACFSFHPRKVLVTGEGGMITTDDQALAERLRRLRHHGMSISDHARHLMKRVVVEDYGEIGYNFRLSDLHAAVGIAQLGKLDALVTRRRDLGERYDRALSELSSVAVRATPAYARGNYQSYICRLRKPERSVRDRLLDALEEHGVASRRGLMAIHRQRPYRDARTCGDLRVTELVDDTSFLLPIYGDLTAEDQLYVISRLQASLEQLGESG